MIFVIYTGMYVSEALLGGTFHNKNMLLKRIPHPDKRLDKCSTKLMLLAVLFSIITAYVVIFFSIKSKSSFNSRMLFATRIMLIRNKLQCSIPTKYARDNITFNNEYNPYHASDFLNFIKNPPKVEEAKVSEITRTRIAVIIKL